jgi:S1-C subfamily serine protease
LPSIRATRLAAGAAVTATALLAVACSNTGTSSHASDSSSPSSSVSPSAGHSPSVAHSDGGGTFGKIPGIVRKTQPAVVTITDRTAQGKALGSGWIYKSSGIIVTDAHVVRHARKIRVSFADGKQDTGHVRATDPITDLAVVKVDRDHLPTLTLENGRIAVGQLAVVLGSPLGLEKSVSAGIISGSDRTLPQSNDLPEGLFDMLQTDAPISPGNSGGPVVGANGKVVGISEAYVPPEKGAVAIGFASPAPTIKTIVSQLLKSGHAKHAYLGIARYQDASQLAPYYGLHRNTGVVVETVVGGSPADHAGLKTGDIIIGLAGKKISDTTDFLRVLRGASPGQAVTFKVDHNGNVKKLHATLGNRAKAVQQNS